MALWSSLGILFHLGLEMVPNWLSGALWAYFSTWGWKGLENGSLELSGAAFRAWAGNGSKMALWSSLGLLLDLGLEISFKLVRWSSLGLLFELGLEMARKWISGALWSYFSSLGWKWLENGSLELSGAAFRAWAENGSKMALWSSLRLLFQAWAGSGSKMALWSSLGLTFRA